MAGRPGGGRERRRPRAGRRRIFQSPDWRNPRAAPLGPRPGAGLPEDGRELSDLPAEICVRTASCRRGARGGAARVEGCEAALYRMATLGYESPVVLRAALSYLGRRDRIDEARRARREAARKADTGPNAQRRPIGPRAPSRKSGRIGGRTDGVFGAQAAADGGRRGLARSRPTEKRVGPSDGVLSAAGVARRSTMASSVIVAWKTTWPRSLFRAGGRGDGGGGRKTSSTAAS